MGIIPRWMLFDIKAAFFKDFDPRITVENSPIRLDKRLEG